MPGLPVSFTSGAHSKRGMVRDTETNLVRLPSSRGSHTKDPCQGVIEENLIQDCLPAGNSQYHNVWINFPPSGTELRRVSSGDRDFCKAAQEANNTEDPRPELSQKEKHGGGCGSFAAVTGRRRLFSCQETNLT